MFAKRVEDLEVVDTFDGHYHDGFYSAQSMAGEIAYQADELVRKLFDALCDRHADDLVDELKEEFGYDY